MNWAGEDPAPGFRVRPGRRLKWSPAWEEEDGVVVFCATSGDYWVLSTQAAALVRRVIAGEPTARVAVFALEDLAEAGLLERIPPEEVR